MCIRDRVEEMVRVPNSSEWKITFYAHSGDNPQVGTLADLMRRQRIEKVVFIGADDGSLIAVKNPTPSVPF